MPGHSEGQVFFGTSHFATICLRHLVESGSSPCLVVTQPDASKGRSGTPSPSPVGVYAQSLGIELHRPKNVNVNDSLERLKAANASLFIVVAYGQKLGPELLAIPPKGTVNIHASLLPKYRGAAPIQKAILEGESISGISLIDVVEKMDAGDVLAREELEIGSEEIAGELHDRLAELGGRLMVASLNDILEGRAVRVPQDKSRVTWAKQLRKSDGQLDLHQSCERSVRFIRAMNPWPMAFVSWNDGKGGRQRLSLLKAKCYSSKPIQSPGHLVVESGRLFVTVGNGQIEILQIQKPGKKPHHVGEFLRGAKMETGHTFE